MMIYIINNQPHPQGVFMVKNYKLILIGVLVSCSLSNTMEKATIGVAQAEIEKRNAEAMTKARESDTRKLEKINPRRMASTAAINEKRSNDIKKAIDSYYRNLKKRKAIGGKPNLRDTVFTLCFSPIQYDWYNRSKWDDKDYRIGTKDGMID